MCLDNNWNNSKYYAPSLSRTMEEDEARVCGIWKVIGWWIDGWSGGMCGIGMSEALYETMHLEFVAVTKQIIIITIGDISDFGDAWK